MLKVHSLYPHLSAQQIDEIEKFDREYKVVPSDADELLHRQIQSAYDITNPILEETGNRVNDIDALLTASSDVARNILLKRFAEARTAQPDTSLLSDEQIAELAVNPSMTPAEFSDMFADAVDADRYLTSYKEYQASLQVSDVESKVEPKND